MRRGIWVGFAAAALLVAGAAMAEDNNIMPRLAALGGAGAQGYWLGLQVEAVEPTLRAQLALAENEGVQVNTVVPNTPAAKAGIKQYDVLLKAGDKKLAAAGDLVQAVAESQGKTITLALIRAGKQLTVEVQPAKPDQMRVEMLGDVPDGAMGDLLNLLQNYRATGAPDVNRPSKNGPDVNGPLQFHVFGPAVVVQQGFAPSISLLSNLPADTTVSITKQGDSPVKVAVQQGDKHWELTWKLDGKKLDKATREELDKLPRGIREYLGNASRETSVSTTTRGAPNMNESVTSSVFATSSPAEPHATTNGPHTERLERHVQELTRQIEALRKEVEAMKSHQ